MSREETNLLFKIFIINNSVVLHLHDEPLFARGTKWPLRILPAAQASPTVTFCQSTTVKHSEFLKKKKSNEYFLFCAWIPALHNLLCAELANPAKIKALQISCRGLRIGGAVTEWKSNAATVGGSTHSDTRWHSDSIWSVSALRDASGGTEEWGGWMLRQKG